MNEKNLTSNTVIHRPHTRLIEKINTPNQLPKAVTDIQENIIATFKKTYNTVFPEDLGVTLKLNADETITWSVDSAYKSIKSIYICGDYSKEPDKLKNLCATLTKQGFYVINPTGLIESNDGTHNIQCCRRHLTLLLSCDYITVAENWADNKITALEVFVASCSGLSFVKPDSDDDKTLTSITGMQVIYAIAKQWFQLILNGQPS